MAEPVTAAETSGNPFDFLSAPEAPDELGRLGGYRVLRQLGEGGMGIIFEAEDVQLQRRVALKVMKPALSAHATARERFLREARAAAAIEHDHIITIHQIGEDRGVCFLAMPMLKGEALDRWLERGLALPLSQALRIGQEIAAGLTAAHARGLVHRDIKPANIWLEAPHGRVKILDFGLARGKKDAHLTQNGAFVGTPAYMAPEQARSEEVNHLADLFSLGCVLYRLCTGRLPFEGKDMLAMLLAVATQPPRRPLELNAALPQALDNLIMLLLEKDPAKRPASATTVNTALKQIEKNLASGGRPPPVAGASAAQPLQQGADAPRSPIDDNPWRDLAEAASKIVVQQHPLPSKKPTNVKLETSSVAARGPPEPRRYSPALAEYDAANASVDAHTASELRPSGSAGAAALPDGRGWRLKWLIAAAIVVLLGGIGTWQIIIRITDKHGKVTEIRTDAENKVEVIRPPPLHLKSPAALTPTALVTAPPLHPGLKSWTIETNSTRGSPLDVLYSPDGRYLVSGGEDGSIRIYEAESGRLVRVLISPSGPCSRPAWSRDSQWLALAARIEGTTRSNLEIWNVEQGSRRHAIGGLEAFPCTGLAWAPDGKTVAYAFAQSYGIQLIDFASGQLLRRFGGHAQPVSCVDWSPDGKLIASGSVDQTVRLHDVATKKTVHVLEGHAGTVQRVAFSPDGKRLATGVGKPKAVNRVWDVATGKQIAASTKTNAHSSVPLAWSPDSKRLACKEEILDVETGQIQGGLFAACDVESWSPDGKSLAGHRGESIRFFSVGGKLLHRFIPANPPISGYPGAWSPDGKTWAVRGGTYSLVCLLDTTTGRFLQRVNKLAVGCAAWAPDGKMIAVIVDRGGKRSICLCAPGGSELRQILEGPGLPSAWAWAPDGKTLAAGSPDGVIRLWDVASGKPRKTLEGHTERISALAWSPDGKTLASATKDKDQTTRLWDVDSGKTVQTLSLQTSVMAWSPDSKRLALLSNAGGHFLWDVETRMRIKLKPGRGFYSSVVWPSDGKTLVAVGIRTANVPPSVNIWDTSQPNEPPRIVEGFPASGPLSPDGQWLVCRYGSAWRLYEAGTGKPRASVVLLDKDRWVTISPDGHYRGSPDVEKEIVYVVQTDQGQQTLTPAEFAKKYGWKDAPERVRLTGK